MNMGNPKVKVAIYDNDLRVRKVKKFELSDDGTQIRIVQGGANHFMPQIDNDSFLDIPRFKKFLLFGEKQYEKTFFVKNKGEKCVNFKTEKAFGPSPEVIDDAVGALVLSKVGTEKPPMPWYITVMLVLILLLLAINSHVLGVF